MYPFFRMAYQLWLYRKAPALPILGTHVSRHRCWPWDLDPWVELNNGRTLTLFDLGRVPLGRRNGLHKALSVLGSGAVFLTGMAVTAGMAFGAWRLVREQSKLPDERPAAAG